MSSGSALLKAIEELINLGLVKETFKAVGIEGESKSTFAVTKEGKKYIK